MICHKGQEGQRTVKNENSKKSGESASQKARQNRLGMKILSALAFVAALLMPAAAVAQPNVAAANAQTAAETSVAIRGQLQDLGTRLSFAPCNPNQYRVEITVPVPGSRDGGPTVQVPACVTTDHPLCQGELEGVRDTFLRAETREIRQQVAIASLMRWRSITEQRLGRIEATNDRQDGDLAAIEVMDSQMLAYIQQLGGPWADAVVEAITRINGWVETINSQLRKLRDDLTAETNRAQNAERDERNARLAAEAAAAARMNGMHDRLIVGLGMNFIYSACAADNDCWYGGAFDVNLRGRPMATSRFMVEGDLQFGYLRSRREWGVNALLTQASIGAGYMSADSQFTISAGGQAMSAITSEIDSGVAVVGAGVFAQASWRPAPFVAFRARLGGIWGSGRGEGGSHVVYEILQCVFGVEVPLGI